MIFEKIVVGQMAVNCYLIGCEQTKRAAIIDPGDEMKSILGAIQEKGLTLTKILLTHGHVDHLTQLHALKAKTGAEVSMHQKDEFLLSDVQQHAMFFGLPDPGTPKPDRFLEDGDVIDIGNTKVNVLHTPGHSPGSVTFHVDNRLFVGDLIFAGSIGRTDLPGGDYDNLMKSVRTKIFTLPDSTIIYPGHGPETTVGREKKSNQFFS
ncbi:MAG: MBL fold metallo-hydrolase [Candidatus Lokiarchaeota archaeon]|nr:MBL fold metallo-hydrolase [Candidatus Lokiarchaeota archaeon]